MNWGQYFSSGILLGLVVPVLIGLAIIAVLYFLRRYLFSYIDKITAKTATSFDDVLVRDTRIASLLWCIWLGLWAAYNLAETPPAWKVIEDKVIPVLFVAIGIYTGIAVVMAILRWYRKAICPRTRSSLDDMIISTVIICTPIIGGGLGVILVLNMLGIGSVVVNYWMSLHLAKLAFLFIITIILLLITTVVVPRAVETTVRRAGAEQTEDELNKRSDTLVSVIGTTIQIIIIFIFLLMVLTEFNINIAAILTGAGVVGLAVGFGAQSLVKDLLAGLFIILENQYRKGDVVKIADVAGVVEEINLRRTILRDLDGINHVVPNGEIRVASNYTKQWSRANLNISVSYDTDLERAMAVINRVGQEMADDPKWASALLSPPKALRVDNLGDSGIEIKVLGETKPIRQWEVMGELRLRLKKAFDAEGIEIPWPHTKVYFGNLPTRITVQNEQAPGEKKNAKPPA